MTSAIENTPFEVLQNIGDLLLVDDDVSSLADTCHVLRSATMKLKLHTIYWDEFTHSTLLSNAIDYIWPLVHCVVFKHIDLTQEMMIKLSLIPHLEAVILVGVELEDEMRMWRPSIELRTVYVLSALCVKEDQQSSWATLLTAFPCLIHKQGVMDNLKTLVLDLELPPYSSLQETTPKIIRHISYCASSVCRLRGGISQFMNFGIGLDRFTALEELQLDIGSGCRVFSGLWKVPFPERLRVLTLEVWGNPTAVSFWGPLDNLLADINPYLRLQVVENMPRAASRHVLYGELNDNQQHIDNNCEASWYLQSQNGASGMCLLNDRSNMITVVYMAEPGRDMNVEDAILSLDFDQIDDNGVHPISIHFTWLQNAFPNQIWMMEEPGLNCIIFNNWLQVPARLKSHGCNVLLWSIQDFLTNKDAYKARLILGGIDHTLDRGAYTEHEYDAIISRTEELEGHRPYITWPGSKASIHTGDKLKFTREILEPIANMRQEPRPKTVGLHSPPATDSRWTEWENKTIVPNMVLKRGRSDCGNCVIRPKERQTKMPPWGAIKGARDLWYAQEDRPSLIDDGELRILCISGTVCDIIHTKPSGEDMDCRVAETVVVPLWVFQSKLPQIPWVPKVYHPGFKGGKEQVIAWGSSILGDLIAKEEEVLGIMQNLDNVFHFFINEIERDRIYPLQHDADTFLERLSETFLHLAQNNHKMYEAWRGSRRVASEQFTSRPPEMQAVAITHGCTVWPDGYHTHSVREAVKPVDGNLRKSCLNPQAPIKRPSDLTSDTIMAESPTVRYTVLGLLPSRARILIPSAHYKCENAEWPRTPEI
ncbi:hypothetical protein C8J56DRAFT_907360 [Mycena floridula]|nr:hypothetical protein C8J56DRAFT_907360 [Mycena floridula]